MKSAFKLALLCAAACVISALGLAASPQFQVASLQPSSLMSGDAFGRAVAVDGDTAAVSASNASVGGLSACGRVFVFRRVGDNWSQEAIVGPNDPIQGLAFGHEVKISGNRMFVSAPGATTSSPQNRAGAVYVFRRSGSFPFAVWTQVAKLLPSDASNGQGFGQSIAVSGNKLLVGCISQGLQGWAAYYFDVQSSGAATLAERVVVQPYVGRACALDGDLAAMSKYGTFGEIRIYSRASGMWQEAAVMSPPQSENDNSFGWSIDLKSGLLIVGQPYYRVIGGAPGRSGRLLSSRLTSSGWTSLHEIEWVTHFPAFDAGEVGYSVATNGSEIVSYANAPTAVGVSLVLARWSSLMPVPDIVGAVFPVNPANYLGGSLDIDGDLVVIGRNDLNAAVVSLVPPPPASYCTGKVNSAGCVGTISAVGSASATVSAPFEVRAASVLNNKNGLLFFGTNGRTAFPFQGGFLCVLPPTRRTTSQFSGGSFGASNCSGSYVYNFNTLIQSGAHPDLVPGVMINAQYWYRDPASASTTGLTTAIEFGVGF